MAQKLAPRTSDRLYRPDPVFLAETAPDAGRLEPAAPPHHHNDEIAPVSPLRAAPVPAPVPDDDHPTVGRILKSARIEQGAKPIAEIAHDLRIRPHLLDALENDDYDQLPGLIYAAGFLRSYAQYLGLDGTDLVERLKESGRARTLETQLIFPEPLEDPRIPRRPIVIMACLMALAVYGVWYGFSARDAGDLHVTAAPGPEFKAVLTEVPAQPVPAEPQVTPDAEDMSAPSVPEAVEVTPIEAAPAEAPAPASPEPQVADGASGQITLKARSAAWIRIEGPDEQPVVDTVLKPGEEVNAPSGRGFVMMTGNAGALEVTVGGRALGPLGPEGAVRHHVALDKLALADTGLNGQ